MASLSDITLERWTATKKGLNYDIVAQLSTSSGILVTVSIVTETSSITANGASHDPFGPSKPESSAVSLPLPQPMTTLTTPVASEVTATSTSLVSSLQFNSHITNSQSQAASPLTSANATNPQPAKANYGVSSGTLTGTAIACLLLGATVASLLAWAIFTYRRKNNRRPSHAGIHSEAASSSNEEHKYMPLVPVPIRISEQPSRNDPEITPFPPPSLAPAVAISTIDRKRMSVISVNALDKVLSVLRTQVKTLFEQAELHVDNFYVVSNNGLPLLTPEQQQSVQELDTPYLEDSVAGVLPQAQSPRTLITHCLAYMIVSGIDFTSTESRSHPLLPSDMISLYQIISTTASERQQRQWRNDTMALIRRKAIVCTVEATASAQRFTHSFSPWASGTYSPEARISHLTKVITDAVELGAEIFGNPDDFKWHWQNRAGSDSNSSPKTLVVFPGLSMVTSTHDLDYFSEHNSDSTGKKQFEVVAPFIAGL